MHRNYIDAQPDQLPKDIFRLYQLCSIENAQNTGLMVEDGCFEFILVKEHNIRIQIQDKPPIKLPQYFSLGKLPLPYRLIYPDSLNYFAIKIQPWVSSFFFPNDYGIIDLSKTYASDIIELHKKVFSSNSFEDMVHHTEAYFLTKPLPNINELIISRAICNQIYDNKGIIKIKDLLDLFPYSRQKLNDLFFHQTKNSIKEFAGYVRIREVIKNAVNHRQKSLTSIAMDYGYFDQSHFIKDLKKATGISPSKFISEAHLFSEQLKL
ncbi:helix-turn-helix domain-containing protein [Winogradskyella sp.]|uniref:helix-turn-helix domain-containing protein n=1 Tax=Winogradskyella sp. TaxID=1883156 RepID=UPI003BAC8B26